jgi:hypothetical protein
MKTVRCLCAAVAIVILASQSNSRAQDVAKPGPEHEILKKLVGDWDLTLKTGEIESKGTSTYKMDLGGLWLASTVESEIAGQKFTGRGFDTFDATKKKYVGLWLDSMSTSPMIMEGAYDSGTKTLTMIGDGPGMDGKPTKFKAVTVLTDADTINFSMFMGDVKEPAFTILYKRKK